MANGYAALGKARRNIINRQKKQKVFEGALDVFGSVAVLGASQAVKADTAWGEYEAGYKEISGTDFKRPEFGDEGYFKSKFMGPKGETRIGNRIYDREKIQQIGSFLDTDAATALFAGDAGQKMKKSYIEMTAPGRSLYQPTTDEVISQKRQIMGEGTYRDPSGQVSDYNPYTDLEETYGDSLYGPKTDERKSLKELAQDRLYPITSMQRQKRPTDGLYSPSKVNVPQIPRLDMPIPGMSSEEVASRRVQEEQWKRDRMPDPQGRSYDEEYPGEMNWLDSYYENNRRRKTY